MKFKPVMTWSPRERKLRLFRVMWIKGKVGFGGYSDKLSLALVPRLVGWSRGFSEWRLTFLGLHVHGQRSYSGIHV